MVIIAVLATALLPFSKHSILPDVDRFSIVAGAKSMSTKLAFKLWVEVPLLLRLILEESFDHFDTIDRIVDLLMDQQLCLLRRQLMLLNRLDDFVDPRRPLLL